MERMMSRRIFTHKGRVNYAIDAMPRSFWFQFWKPVWHEGRGYYISVGCWLFAFYRGY